MKFTLKRPCSDCPFLKVGGIRLTRTRALEIASGMLSLQGIVFSCHQTTIHDDDGEYIPRKEEQHCAGALIFAEKHQNATQMMRIAERLGSYDAAAVLADPATVARIFDSLAELSAAQWDV